MKMLEKIPWDFSFRFICNDPNCKIIHKLKITDWELYQAYRNFKKTYSLKSIALEKLKEKYMGFFLQRVEKLI